MFNIKNRVELEPRPRTDRVCCASGADLSGKGRGRYNGRRPQFCTWRKTLMPTDRVYRIAVIPGRRHRAVIRGRGLGRPPPKNCGFELRQD